MVAVNTVSERILRRKRAENLIILFLRGSFKESQKLPDILHTADSGQHSQYARPVERILDTLVSGKFLSKGRGLGIQKLSAGKWFHDRDPNPLSLAAPVEIHALIRAAFCVFAVMIIIARVNGKHQLLDHTCIQNHISDLWGMCGQADMSDHPLLLKI